MVKLLGWLLIAGGVVALVKGQILGIPAIVLGLYLSGLIRAGRRRNDANSGFGLSGFSGFSGSGGAGDGGSDD